MEKREKIDLVVRTFTKIERSLDRVDDKIRFLEKNKSRVIIAGSVVMLVLGIWIAGFLMLARAIGGKILKTGQV